MKQKREPFRYLIIFLVYIIASISEIFFAYLSSFPLWLTILLVDIYATVFIFIFSLLTHNASFYDPYWSFQPMVIIIGLILFKKTLNTMMILYIISIFIWGIRLTANWAYTFKGISPAHQDWRYTMLHEKTGKMYFFVNFFGIHLVPTLIVYSAMLPVIFVFEQSPRWNIGSLCFFILSLLAVFIEGLADCTMHHFKKEGKKGFNRLGVWKYSRHPNYLGEITFWWAIALMAICVIPSYWWIIFGAFLNTCLFLFISIPMADQHQSRKVGFDLYKQNTRKLLPIYKKQFISK